MDYSQEYIDFQNCSPSPFHVTQKMLTDLEGAGFIELNLNSSWSLTEKNYFIRHKEGKSLVAFSLGENSPLETGFSIIASHTDSPAFKLRTEGYEDLILP